MTRRRVAEDFDHVRERMYAIALAEGREVFDPVKYSGKDAPLPPAEEDGA